MESTNGQVGTLKEVKIQFTTPFKFDVFINGTKLENVKRFALDIENIAPNLNDAKYPTYTVEHYLKDHKK